MANDVNSMSEKAKEMIDIVDDDDNVIGEGELVSVVTSGKIFRAARVVVINSRGEFVVHKRNPDMIVFPGHFDIGAAGIVNAGEDYKQAAERELEEELGIAGVELTHFISFKARGRRNLNVQGFWCKYDGPLKIQPEEITEASFMSIEDVQSIIADQPFHPGGKFVFERCVEEKCYQ